MHHTIHRCTLKPVCASCRVQGFPTIKAWVGGKLVEYQGDRSAGNLKNWALSLLPNKA